MNETRAEPNAQHTWKKKYLWKISYSWICLMIWWSNSLFKWTKNRKHFFSLLSSAHMKSVDENKLYVKALFFFVTLMFFSTLYHWKNIWRRWMWWCVCVCKNFCASHVKCKLRPGSAGCFFAQREIDFDKTFLSRLRARMEKQDRSKI